METVKGKRLHEFVDKDDQNLCKWCGKEFESLLDDLFINFPERYRYANFNFKLKQTVDECYPCIFVSDDERMVRDIIE